MSIIAIKKKRKRKRKSRYIRGVHISPFAGACRFRSSWEQNYMIYLDENPDVVSWSYEKLIIEYVSNVKTKKVRKYYPDFQVEYRDGKKVVIEIKPSRKLQQAIVVKKINAVTQWCAIHNLTFKILTEIDLRDMGLI